MYEDLINKLRELPHLLFVQHGEPVYDMWWCSACGEYFDEWDDRPTWKYCPNCGAKMNGGDEDEEPQKEET